ncbi:MAG: cytochrome bd quinol oxidase subunit 2 apoprotein [Acidobacteriales bacterium]|nr:cytochrome bd quinol oxidase subunit 2 apoprotein [Terriglobales bacterium]
METVWFILVALMLTGYVVLDGFDLGAGIIHLLVAKTNDERRLVIRAIGPVWDGNEVWLLAAGGTLFFAFPPVYASSFSGFYLPLNIVLWLLVLRAIGIEMRAHMDNQVWCDFFDGLFAIGSILLTIFFGAALGNVVRGVPLSKDGVSFAPLWTDFRVGPQPGVLDWYTILSGVVAFVALALHGAHYVALKTEGDLNARTRNLAKMLWPILAALTLLSLFATMYVRPGVMDNYRNHPVSLLVPILVVGSLGLIFTSLKRGDDFKAFLGSSTYLATMLVGAAFALYPTLLPSSSNPSLDLTIHNSAAGQYALQGGITWWTAGMAVAIGYFVLVYWLFRGKVSIETGEHGY